MNTLNKKRQRRFRALCDLSAAKARGATSLRVREHITFKQLIRDLQLFLAFGFGSGLSPYAPGTMGTFVALLFYPLIASLPWFIFLLIWFLFCVGAIYLADIAERKTGIHDDPRIVCDEMVGFWLALWLLPSGITWLVIAFILFRFLDIFKPWPIYLLQKLPGGWGCVLDDVGAGFETFLLIQIGFFIFKV